jgi:hypothetical protein
MLKTAYISNFYSRFNKILDFSKLPENFSVRDYIYPVCSIHGAVKGLAGSISRWGCPECRKESTRKRKHQYLLDKLYKRGGNEYIYLSVSANTRMHDKILIKHSVCEKEFKQKVFSHLNGQGCPYCAEIRIAESHRLGKIEIIRRCKESVKHSTIDYNKSIITESVKIEDNILLYCNVHGFFEQNLAGHLYAEQSCPFCGYERNSINGRIGKIRFIKIAIEHHGVNAFDYSSIPEDIKITDRVPIRCRKCNSLFYQIAREHLRSSGCPHCGRHYPRWENDLFDVIKNTLHLDVIQHYTGWDGNITRGKEIDIFIPSLRRGIECNGVHWHSSDKTNPSPKPIDYHKNKQLLARNKNIQLFFIWDDVDFNVNVEKVRKVLLSDYQAEPYKIESGIYYYEKDLCPTIDLASKELIFIQDIGPRPKYRYYYGQSRLTYDSGLWAFRK